MFYIYHLSAKQGTAEAVLFSEEPQTLEDHRDDWYLTSAQKIDASLPSGFPTDYLMHRE